MGYFDNPSRSGGNNNYNSRSDDNNNYNSRSGDNNNNYNSRSNDNYNNSTPRYQNDPVEDEVFSVPVKAGKRIYYFDVKATRGDDYYVTITESRKRPTRDGGFTIDKHKIHLYKEDFMKFAAGLEEVLAYVRREKPEFAEAEERGDYNRQYEGGNYNNNENEGSTELKAQSNDNTEENNEIPAYEPLEKEIFGDL